MQDKDYTILKMLDEERNMTKAAEKLFISQPTLTYRLRKIEEYFNTEIFIRDSSGLLPTPKGELIINLAKENLKNINGTLSEIELMEETVRGTIKLGVSSTFGQYILPTLLKEFQELYPEVNFNIITGLSSDISKLFETGDIHIAILRGDYYMQEEKQLIMSEPICIVSKNPVNVSELPTLPRIHYEMDSYLEGMIEAWWKVKFDEPSTDSMTVDSLETAKEMARVGLGFTILPGISLINEPELAIQHLYNEKNELIRRVTWAYCRQDTMKFLAVKKFYEFLDNHPFYSKLSNSKTSQKIIELKNV